MKLKSTVHKYFDAIARKDRKAWLDCFSDDPGLSHVDPVGSPARTRKEDVGAFWDQIHSLFESVVLEIEHLYPGSPEVLALTWVGRGRGFNGVDVTFRGIDVFRADPSGKILQMEAYWDANATLGQLLPAEASR